MCGAGVLPARMAGQARRQGWRVVAFTFGEAPGVSAHADRTIPSLLNEAGAMQVARRLARDEHDRRRSAGHHAIPARASPASSAIRRHSSLSRISTRSASTATTVAPPDAAAVSVSGPIVGVSKR